MEIGFIGLGSMGGPMSRRLVEAGHKLTVFDTRKTNGDIPTLTELVGKTGGGVVAPREPRAIAGAIRELLADPARLRALGESGRGAWEREFTVEAVSTRLAGIYAHETATEAVCAA